MKTIDLYYKVEPLSAREVMARIDGKLHALAKVHHGENEGCGIGFGIGFGERDTSFVFNSDVDYDAFLLEVEKLIKAEKALGVKLKWRERVLDAS